MMCLACQQEAMWFAYLRRRGLIDENGDPVEPVPSIAYPVEAMSTEEQTKQKVDQSASETAETTTSPFDTPKAG